MRRYRFKKSTSIAKLESKVISPQKQQHQQETSMELEVYSGNDNNGSGDQQQSTKQPGTPTTAPNNNGGGDAANTSLSSDAVKVSA